MGEVNLYKLTRCLEKLDADKRSKEEWFASIHMDEDSYVHHLATLVEEFSPAIAAHMSFRLGMIYTLSYLAEDMRLDIPDTIPTGKEDSNE